MSRYRRQSSVKPWSLVDSHDLHRYLSICDVPLSLNNTAWQRAWWSPLDAALFLNRSHVECESVVALHGGCSHRCVYETRPYHWRQCDTPLFLSLASITEDGMQHGTRNVMTTRRPDQDLRGARAPCTRRGAGKGVALLELGFILLLLLITLMPGKLLSPYLPFIVTYLPYYPPLPK